MLITARWSKPSPAQRQKNLPFLPLFQDSANPNPGQGWNHHERRNLINRCQNLDAVIALAFEHHLVIGRNILLPEVVNWIVGLAPLGIIEFVHKDDQTIQKCSHCAMISLQIIRWKILPAPWKAVPAWCVERKYLPRAGSYSGLVETSNLTSGGAPAKQGIQRK
jgi:hypothetical protein